MSVENTEDWIPNINMGQDYDDRYLDAEVHYEALNKLAGFFGRDMPVHRHAQYLQIHYIDRGKINFHIDDQLFQVEGPACFLTPPTVPHSFQTDTAANGHVLTIGQSLIWQLMKNGLQKEDNLDLNQGICLAQNALSENQKQQWQLITLLLDSIKNEWRSDEPGKALILKKFIGALVIIIARLGSHKVTSTPVNNQDLRQFNRFTDLVEQHYSDHWRLSEYTQLMGLSESRLNQICNKISNASPKKLIRDRLVQESKRLLIFSNLTSNEIAYRLGFSDPAYFSRFFKTQTTLTTQAYRKSH